MDTQQAPTVYRVNVNTRLAIWWERETKSLLQAVRWARQEKQAYIVNCRTWQVVYGTDGYWASVGKPNPRARRQA